MFQTSETGTYMVKGLVKSDQSSKLTIELGDQQVVAEVEATGDEMLSIDLGEVSITKAGEQLLLIRPDREQWNGLELGQVLLLKQ